MIFFSMGIPASAAVEHSGLCCGKIWAHILPIRQCLSFNRMNWHISDDELLWAPETLCCVSHELAGAACSGSSSVGGVGQHLFLVCTVS